MYLIFVFTKLIRHKDFSSDYESQTYPPVSIVISAMNELENLKELIPILESQNYPKFEIVIADDRSSDGTYDFLISSKMTYRKVVFARIESTPAHFTSKKYALTVAIKKSRYDIILTTDADCRPTSENWIKQMVLQLTQDKDVVLGVSPYTNSKGLLNAFIRYETLQTAVQYLSFALAKVPFMGVGRNLMFRKSLFWKTNGYMKHADLLSGDDDLFINEAANSRNVAVSVAYESFTLSEPKQTFKEWVTQKRRHLSVGKRYKTKDRLLLGAQWLSLLTAWLLFIPTLFIQPNLKFSLIDELVVSEEWLKQYGLKHWEPFTNWMKFVLISFLGWLIIRWIILALCNKRLSGFVKGWKIIWFDFLYVFYLLVFGIMTMFSNPKKLKWK